MDDIEVHSNATSYRKKRLDEILKKIKEGTATEMEINALKTWVVDDQSKELSKRLARKITSFTSKEHLISQFLKIQPIFYDKARNWWVWDYNKYKWVLVDEIDILNSLRQLSTANTINAKERTEILEALKQEARLNQPKEIKKTWIQFQSLVYDIKTGDEFKATPEYFVTNPIPWALHKERFKETPVMDKIFEEWVGKDNVPLLYEIIAYCMLPNYPIHRIFCFLGSGSNGKSCFLRLLAKFIGEENYCSSEIDTIINSRFETAKLYKKLVCLMGETNFNELSRTERLKKLTGQDPVGIEFKNKTPFDYSNYAKILIATNSLPVTADKTIGFYRRWTILDFPNQFGEAKEILSDIPEEEYECLAVKCCFLIKDILDRRSFTNEGSLEERQKKYESKSNFLQTFLNDFTEKIEGEEYITVNDFNKKFGAWCKENRHREMSETTVGMEMKKLGYEQTKRYFQWLFDGHGGQARCWEGLKWK